MKNKCNAELHILGQHIILAGRCDCMVVEITIIYAIVSINPPHSKVYSICQLLATEKWFSQGTRVSSANKTDRHKIAEILLKAALNTITLTPDDTWIRCT
jgi:hypothetical protein